MNYNTPPAGSSEFLVSIRAVVMPSYGSETEADGDPSGTTEDPTPRRPGRTRWFLWMGLIGYVVFLLVFAWATYGHGPIIQLDDLLDPRPALTRITIAGLLAGARFLVLGFLMGIAVGRPATSGRFSGVLGWWLMVLLVGTGLLVLISITGSGRWPYAATSLLPMTGYLVGAWIGATCLRGLQATLWLVPKLALLFVTFGAGALGLVSLAIDQDCLAFQTPRVTSAEKRRLADVLRHRHPAGDGLSRLSLTQRDVNLLLTLGMAQALPKGKAEITLDEGTVAGNFSMPVGDASASSRCLNVQARCRAKMEDGQLEIGLERCRVGRVPVPRLLLGSISRLLVSAILEDPDL
jgi:hypothetical protein